MRYHSFFSCGSPAPRAAHCRARAAARYRSGRLSGGLAGEGARTGLRGPRGGVEGRDPVSDKRTSTPRVPSCREATAAFVEIKAPRWRARKHATNWSQSLERHAMPRLGEMPVDRITRADVLAVLTPIWGTRQETARRVRQRVRAVMRWAMAHGHRDDNPAGEAIDGALPPMPAIRAHFRACHTERCRRR